MEFERRPRTHWPLVVLYLIYVCGVVYLLMANNRFLYSHIELRVALAGEQVETITPIPSSGQQPPVGELGDATFWQQANPERSGQDSSAQARDRDYVPEWQKVVVEDGRDGEISSWSADPSGLYLTGSGTWAWAISAEGDIKWRFQLASGSKGIMTPAIDQGLVYLATSTGEVLALNKTSGALQWRIKAADEILTPPLLIRGELWLVARPLASESRRIDRPETAKEASRKAQGPSTHRLVRIRKRTGELAGYSEPFSIKGSASLTWAREAKQVVVTSENRIQLVSEEDGKLTNAQTLADPVIGPAIFADGKVFVSMASGKIQGWEINKKSGKMDWEVDLDSPPLGPLTYIPVFQRLALITTDGHMHMIDIKKAEHLWRFPLDSRNPSHDIFASRLSAKNVEKLNLKWEKKGWTAWAPCSESRLCIYNPDKGQLIGRISASGGVLTPPLFVGKGFYLLTAEKKPESKLRYRVSHYLDEDTFKKKAKAAATEAATPPAAPAEKPKSM